MKNSQRIAEYLEYLPYEILVPLAMFAMVTFAVVVSLPIFVLMITTGMAEKGAISDRDGVKLTVYSIPVWAVLIGVIVRMAIWLDTEIIE